MMHPTAFVPRANLLLCVLLFAWAWLLPLAAGAQIAIDGRTNTEAAAQVPRSLEPARLLERVQSASLVIRRSVPLVGSGSVVGGFVFGGGAIVTSVAVLDATDDPEFLWPNGVKVPLSGVVALDRREGWAVLAVASTTTPEPLPRAAAAFKDGDRCFVLGRLPDGDELFGRGTVLTGRRSGGLHCVAEFAGARPVPGSPVLNATGDVAGIAGTWMTQSAGPMHRQVEVDPERPIGLCTPVIPLPPASAGRGVEPMALESLRRRGTLLAPVVHGHVSDGGFSRGLTTGNHPAPVTESDVFARGDVASMYVFVRWAPMAKLAGDLVLRVFDERNALLGQSPPSKTKLEPGRKLFQSWRMPVPPQAGEYRVDVSIGPAVYWRSYATVTDTEASLDRGAATDAPRPAGASSPPRKIGGVIRPPQKLVDVRPIYPLAAQEARIQGVVVIEATIEPTGEVTNPRVLQSIPALDNAALEAVRRWRFTATLVEGVPVPVVMTMTSRFSLQ